MVDFAPGRESVSCDTYYKRQLEGYSQLAFPALTYMMIDLRKWVQNLALHPLPSILGASHDELGQSFLQESFALGARSRLEKFVLT